MSAPHARVLGSALSALTVLGATFAMAPSAWAAAPSNDNRSDATVLHPSQSVTGTLVEATLEATNDGSGCGGSDGSVWYRFNGPARGDVVIELDAGGAMDATIDLYKQVRSKLKRVHCRSTDSKGLATLDEEGLDSGANYAIRVGNQTGSVAASFKLRVLVPTPPPEPPGRHLPAKGVKNRVDRVLNPGDAYWKKMRAGRTMRLSLGARLCTSLEVFGPGTHDFSRQEPLKRLSCGGYALFTPRTTGRHYLVVRPARDRDIHRYRLRVAPARADDTAPGVLIHNHEKVRGSVNGGLDSRDLYRFDVTRRSALRLALHGAPSMSLVRDDGARLGGGNLVTRHITAGRYFVAVSGSGHYTLRLELRTITRSVLLVNGHHVAKIGPTAKARFLLRVRPGAGGPSLITVERFDPIEGWQFLRNYRPRVVNGTARVTFAPPSIGRYRARADYLGSRDAAPSSTGFARLLVQRPLGT